MPLTRDWLFESSNWRLDTLNYVEPPSSLRMWFYNYTLYRRNASFKAGQVITWAYSDPEIRLGGRFDPVFKGYLLHGLPSALVWTQYQIQWWQGWDYHNDRATCSRYRQLSPSPTDWSPILFIRPFGNEENFLVFACPGFSQVWLDVTEIFYPPYSNF